MATQGLLSVTRGGKVIVKVVCGSDGHRIPWLGSILRKFPKSTPAEILAHARELELGSCGNLVVMTPTEVLGDFAEDELGPLYRKKFSDPKFNPRWEHGTASYVQVVEVE